MEMAAAAGPPPMLDHSRLREREGEKGSDAKMSDHFIKSKNSLACQPLYHTA
jgi:hypothetical protein